MQLLHEVLKIRPEQTKTNLCFDICVPEDFERLEIDFSYCPKWVTDRELIKRLTLEGSIKYGLLPEGTQSVCSCKCPEICNMITLSLDINRRFCGFAHRHASQQHIVVSETEATPGFHKMKPEKGIWHIVIPVNMVATDVCTYEITVSGIESGKQ